MQTPGKPAYKRLLELVSALAWVLTTKVPRRPRASLACPACVLLGMTEPSERGIYRLRARYAA